MNCIQQVNEHLCVGAWTPMSVHQLAKHVDLDERLKTFPVKERQVRS